LVETKDNLIYSNIFYKNIETVMSSCIFILGLFFKSIQETIS